MKEPKNNQIPAKNMKKKIVRFQNGGQKTNFRFVKKSHVTKNWKTTFLKEFCNEIWPKLGDFEYNYNTGINLQYPLQTKYLLVLWPNVENKYVITIRLLIIGTRFTGPYHLCMGRGLKEMLFLITKV